MVAFHILSTTAVLLLVLVKVHSQAVTLDDVALHNTNDDCWSAIYGEVYDLTVYAPTHPNTMVYGVCGQDGTSAFDGVHGSTPQYLDIFPGIDYVGMLVEATPPPMTLLPTPLPTPLPTVPPTTAAPTSLAPTTAPPVAVPATTLAPTVKETTAVASSPTPGTVSTSVPTTTAPADTTISLADLVAHNNNATEGGCWIAFFGNVYNLTSFLNQTDGESEEMEDTPTGESEEKEEDLSPCCGKDCSPILNDIQDLDNLMENNATAYLLGPLERVFTIVELGSKGNASDNCLVSYLGRVFNVTAYVSSINSVALTKQLVVPVEMCGTEITLAQFAAMTPGIGDYYAGALLVAILQNQYNETDENPSGPASGPASIPIMGTVHMTLSPEAIQASQTPAPITPLPTLPPTPAPVVTAPQPEPAVAAQESISNSNRAPVSLTELSQHSSASDCWTVYNAEVYDMTNYNHPGGRPLIEGQCGQDGTSSFLGTHPESYLSMIASSKVGSFDANAAAPAPEPVVTVPAPEPAPEPAPVPVPAPQPEPQPAPAPAPEPAPVDNTAVGITMDEVAMHGSANDCWVVYFDQVYDVTNYANSHPGGANLVTMSCGGDGTGPFSGRHGQGTLGVISGSLLGMVQGAAANNNGGGTNNGGGGNNNYNNGGYESESEDEDEDHDEGGGDEYVYCEEDCDGDDSDDEGDR